MPRNPTIQRLPMPPEVKGTIPGSGEDIKSLHEHIRLMTTLLNQNIQNLHVRQDTVQQVGAKAPPNVTGLAVTGMQGLFHLTWNRIQSTDGYVVVQASDANMTMITGRYNIPDGNTPSHQIPVGNVATTGYFQVYAYQGPKYSQPSPVVSATTAEYGVAESAPTAPPIPPLPPKIDPVRSGPNLP